MLYQKQYFYYFRDLNNVLHTVEVWKYAADGTIISSEVRGDADPFIVSYPETSSKFDPVRGSGCSLNLVSSTSMQFMGLYTAGFKDYMVKLYMGSALIWCGYLDSEIYTEPFNELENYTVSINGTDGLALLDRFNYIQDDGTHFTGISKQFDILKFIIQKLGLPFNSVNIYLSTTATGTIPAVGETLLNVTYSNNSNFYNEDGDPETLRKVLESILQPYGAFIVQSGGSLYITDTQAIASTGLGAMLKYDVSLNYIEEVAVNANLGDLSDIGFTSENQQLSTVPGVNKEIVRYSPYREINVIEFKADEDFSTVDTTLNYGVVGFKWEEKTYSTSLSWNQFYNGRFCTMKGIDGEGLNESDAYLKIGRYVTPTAYAFVYKKLLPSVIPAATFLKVEMKVYARTKPSLNNDAETSLDVKNIQLTARLAIGADVWRSSYVFTPDINQSWGISGTYGMSFYVPDHVAVDNSIVYANIADQWIDYQLNWIYYNADLDKDILSSTPYLIPLTGISGGLLEFSIGEFSASSMSGEVSPYDLRIKDVKLTLCDKDGVDLLDTDVEYVGYMDSAYKNEGSEIDLIQGANLTDFPCERAGLMKCTAGVYSWIKTWSRHGVTDNIENLLLRSYVGNYYGKTLQLTCSINMISSVLGYVTYSGYLIGKFMIIGCALNFAEAIAELTIQEISEDSFTISKSF